MPQRWHWRCRLPWQRELSSSPSSGAQSAAAQTIEVRGNQRVDADTIRSYFRTTPGERLDAIKIDQGLKALYATGLYADVKISQEANRIVVTVVENLTINRVAFEGNKKVKTEVLTGEVQTKARGALSRPMVQADVQRIVEVYRRQGYFNVRVDPKIIDQPNNRVDLVFEITEEQKTTVRKINFVGNKAFSDYKLLDVITTIRSNWLSWLSNRDVYDPERVAADQELLRRFYLKNGYADFRILSATVDMDPDSKGFVARISRSTKASNTGSARSTSSPTFAMRIPSHSASSCAWARARPTTPKRWRRRSRR